MKNSIIVGLLVIVLLLLAILTDSNSKIKSVSKDYTQNIKALTMSLDSLKDSKGRTQYEQQSFDTDLEGLKYLNAQLFNEVQSLKGSVKQITEIKTIVYNTDTMYSKDTLFLRDTLDFYKWSFQDSIWSIKGHTFINEGLAESYLTAKSVSLDLIVGTKEDKEGLKIFAKSNNPNVKITSIIGATIKPYKRRHRFFIGPTVSYGINGNGKFTYNVGVGIGYNLIK